MIEKRERFDWTICIHSTISQMKFLGLWPEGPHYKFDLYSVYAALILTIVTFGHTLFQILNIIFTITDIKSVMSVLYVTLSEALNTFKAYLCVKNIHILKKNLVTLNSDMFQPRSERQIRNIKAAMDWLTLIKNSIYVCVVFAVFFWSTYPIFDGSVKKRQLPFSAWYPFNTTVSPNYEFTYVYQICGIIISALNALTTDTMISALHMYIALLFDVLYDDIARLYSVKEEKGNDSSRELTGLIVRHKGILKFAEDMSKFTNWIVFFQFFISGLAIGFTMFRLTTVATFSSEFFSLTGYLAGITMQIFMYCWFGNEVEVSSTKLPYAFFKSDWVEASENTKREMIIMTERCQRPSKVSALNMFYLSLQTFMKILRAAYSYFALLYQVTS